MIVTIGIFLTLNLKKKNKETKNAKKGNDLDFFFFCIQQTKKKQKRATLIMLHRTRYYDINIIP